MIMEAEKFHDLPPANWKPRKANDVVLVQNEDLRTREANGLSPNLSPETQGSGVSKSGSRRR